MSNKAAWLRKARSNVEIEPADMWSPGPGELLVKNESISVNPIEARIQKFEALPTTYPAILGFSFAGTVIKVGPDVHFTQPGDRVAVARWAKTVSDIRFGAYQKYPLAMEAHTAKLGPNVQLDDASGVLINLATAVSVLSLHLGLDRPPISGHAPPNGKTLLVYGGSSNIGGLAVKYASDAGYKVVTTSSPANKHLVAKRNPVYIIDHTEAPEKVVVQLKAQGPYDAVFDTIGTPDATAILGGVLADTGGAYYSTLPPGERDTLPANVEKKSGFYGMTLNEESNRHVKKWLLEEYLPHGLGNGSIFPSPIMKLDGGLSAVQPAFDKLSSGSASGVKIVINPQEEE